MSFPTYSEALAWLYGTQTSGIKLGLDTIRRLRDALGCEDGDHRFVHVAGTNGKGSTCAMVDSICRAGSLHTGLYTSPHLVSFRERIRVNGETIGESDVTAGLSRIREICEGWGDTHPTFFEITTALALGFFRREKADVVVLETGLGGRLDSTNVVTPLVSVITPISLDHQAWLGNTLGEIAGEKAGIIKPGVPVVSAPQESVVEKVLLNAAAEAGSAIEFVTAPHGDSPLGLVGEHQRWNAALAIRASELAGISVDQEAVARGLRDVSWPGRFQRVGDRFVLDGAHNPAAAERLAATWREAYGDERAIVILGSLEDKDPRAICRHLLPLASRVVVVPVRSARSIATGELLKIAKETTSVPCEEAASVAAAIANSGSGRILVTGSLFLVGEALAHLAGETDRPRETSQ